MKELVLNNVKFQIERLSPSKQFKLLLKIIGIVAKGDVDYSAQIQQVFHNQLQTGEQVDTSTENKYEGSTLSLIVNAVKGALSTLSDDDRDYLINSLLENVTILPNEATPTLIIKATLEQLDKRLKNYTQIFNLLKEVIVVNFTESTADNQ